jgi:type III secretory pathway component EscS
MKRILFLSSLFAVICFAIVGITLSKRNATMSLQTENMEALTNVVVLKDCYLYLTPASGTGVYFYQCNTGTSFHYILYPCGTKIESTPTVPYTDWCYFVPNG